MSYSVPISRFQPSHLSGIPAGQDVIAPDWAGPRRSGRSPGGASRGGTTFSGRPAPRRVSGGTAAQMLATRGSSGGGSQFSVGQQAIESMRRSGWATAADYRSSREGGSSSGASWQEQIPNWVSSGPAHTSTDSDLYQTGTTPTSALPSVSSGYEAGPGVPSSDPAETAARSGPEFYAKSRAARNLPAIELPPNTPPVRVARHLLDQMKGDPDARENVPATVAQILSAAAAEAARAGEGQLARKLTRAARQWTRRVGSGPGAGGADLQGHPAFAGLDDVAPETQRTLLTLLGGGIGYGLARMTGKGRNDLRAAVFAIGGALLVRAVTPPGE